MSLPIYKSDDQSLMLMQTAWASSINPILALPTNNGVTLQSVVLKAGDNTIDHKLGRVLQGWMLVRVRAAAVIYDKQDSNQVKSRTLILNSSAPVTVDLYVF
jgi:hypothetical protein